MSDTPISIGLPTSEQAKQFALMVNLGAPEKEAIRYFIPEGETPQDNQVLALAARWMRFKTVQKELNSLQGKSFEDMTPNERIRCAIDKHYAQLAYFLYTRSYVVADGAVKNKMDTARETLEKKLAGTSGALSAIEAFFNDINSGKLKLDPAPTPIVVASIPAGIN